MSIDISKAKATLLTLQDEYQTRIDKITDHLHNPKTDMGEHWDDQSLVTSQNDMRNNLKAEAEQGLVWVKAALRHIENGTYGICDECGEAIEPKRMEAMPYATLCMTHAE